MSAAPFLDLSLRPLTAADHAARAAGELGSPAPARNDPIAKLRNAHHRAARVVAGAGSDAEAAAVLGWSPARVRELRRSPAFQELLAFYINREDELALSLHARMELLAQDALAELHERLLDPEAAARIGEATLLEVFRTVADRTGHGAQTKTLSAHLVVPAEAERIRAALEGAGERVAVVEDVREALGPGASPVSEACKTPLRVSPAEDQARSPADE